MAVRFMLSSWWFLKAVFTLCYWNLQGLKILFLPGEFMAVPKRYLDTKKHYQIQKFVLKASKPCYNIDISNVAYLREARMRKKLQIRAGMFAMQATIIVSSTFALSLNLTHLKDLCGVNGMRSICKILFSLLQH